MGGLTHSFLMPTLALSGVGLLLHAWKGWLRSRCGWCHGGGAFWSCTHTVEVLLEWGTLLDHCLTYLMHYCLFWRMTLWWRLFFSHARGLFLAFGYVLKLFQGRLVTFDLVECSSTLCFRVFLVKYWKSDLVILI